MLLKEIQERRQVQNLRRRREFRLVSSLRAFSIKLLSLLPPLFVILTSLRTLFPISPCAILFSRQQYL